MIIKILVDNTALDGFEAVHGFSVIIEEEQKILFDVGPDDTFLRNAALLGIDFDEIDTLVLSHGHWDHGGGLTALQDKKLLLHPDSFTLRYRKRNNTPVGLSCSREELKTRYQLQESKEAIYLTDNMVFLGEIPRLIDFESKESPFLLSDGKPDFVPDDSAIAIKTDKGLLVISGCAHAGICNTISYAKKVCKEERVYAVLGGFHLKELDVITQKTIDYLKENKVEIVGPTHCTSFKVRDEFAKYLKVIELNAGTILEL